VSISLDSLRDNFRKARTEGILTETKDPHPYQSERDNQQDTTYELCNFWKLHACKSMTTNNCWNKSCPDHDEYGSPCSFQSERDKVLDELILWMEYNDDLFRYVGNHVLKEKVVAYQALRDHLKELRQQVNHED
jgi:hypothetical protein